MPGCIDCIEEKLDDGYDEKQAVFMSQYPPTLIIIVGHHFLCSRHFITRYKRRRPDAIPTMKPRGPDQGVAK